jgi:hypothetical protein
VVDPDIAELAATVGAGCMGLRGSPTGCTKRVGGAARAAAGRARWSRWLRPAQPQAVAAPAPSPPPPNALAPPPPPQVVKDVSEGKPLDQDAMEVGEARAGGLAGGRPGLPATLPGFAPGASTPPQSLKPAPHPHLRPALPPHPTPPHPTPCAPTPRPHPHPPTPPHPPDDRQPLPAQHGRPGHWRAADGRRSARHPGGQGAVSGGAKGGAQGAKGRALGGAGGSGGGCRVWVCTAPHKRRRAGTAPVGALAAAGAKKARPPPARLEPRARRRPALQDDPQGGAARHLCDVRGAV